MPFDYSQHILYYLQFYLLCTHKGGFHDKHKFYGLVLTYHFVLMVGQTD